MTSSPEPHGLIYRSKVASSTIRLAETTSGYSAARWLEWELQLIQLDPTDTSMDSLSKCFDI